MTDEMTGTINTALCDYGATRIVATVTLKLFDGAVQTLGFEAESDAREFCDELDRHPAVDAYHFSNSFGVECPEESACPKV